MTAAPRIGVIGIPAGWSSQRLAEAVAARTGEYCLIDLAHTVLNLGTGEVRCGDVDLRRFDALVIKKLGDRYCSELLDRLELLHFLEGRGVRIFSRPLSIMRLLDRLSCTVALRLADIPMPETVVTEDVEEAVRAVGEFGAAVFKPLYTSKARGMEVIEHGIDTRERILAFHNAGNHMLYVQRKIELPGRDLGIVFLGGEYLASYARVNQGASWHTSSSKGGRYAPHAPSDELIALAHRAQAIFELDFTCVDIAETDDGPLVFEVSAFGGFRGLLAAAQIDAAQQLSDYVLRRLGNHG